MITDRLRTVAPAAITAIVASLGAANVAQGHGTPPPAEQRAEADIEVRAIEPPLTPTPQGPCGPGSLPETGLQGRVSRADHESGRAAQGYTCNAELVGSYERPNVIGSVGGFKVERYVDAAGHDCAYYDASLLAPTSIADLEGGVNVLDMSDPTNPTLTARLVTPAMFSPHESLVVSQSRGLLVAVTGNPAFAPGFVDVYDISQDCRNPVLQNVPGLPAGIIGHESGISPDGNTFFSGSPGTSLVGVDISNPSLPLPVWVSGVNSHGLSVGAGGDRAYVADTDPAGLTILDTSEVQDRVLNPTVPQISHLTWDSVSIPQNAIPITIKGHPYVVEIDEFGALDEVGAGRIIDIGDETNPQVISNMRLEVHQPENFGTISGDPQAGFPLQGYAGHYCNVPTRVDPEIVACSFILSGLRIFDIRDPYNPKEVAYYNAPIKDRVTPAPFEASNWAMSSPAFVPSRKEIWYSDGFQGFFAVRLTNGVWGSAGGGDAAAAAPAQSCFRATTTLAARPGKNFGTKGADVVVGGKGAERFRMKGGADKVCARRGRDVLRGGPGRDRLRGGKGNDRLVGGPGRDLLACGKGRKDVAIAGPGDRVRSCEKRR